MAIQQVEKGSIPALVQEIQVQVVDVRGREKHMTEIITNWLQDVKATRGRNLPELEDPPVGFNAGPVEVDGVEGDYKNDEAAGDAMPSQAELEAKLAAAQAAEAEKAAAAAALEADKGADPATDQTSAV